MTPAQKILEMIENVDPADSAAMDEIDARVVCYLAGRKYSHHGPWKKRKWVWTFNWIQDWPYRQCPEYTRSRDALKAIRPEGWLICYMQQDWYAEGDYTRIGMKKSRSRGVNAGCRTLPTEELAELHAIISAIEWERTDGKI